MTAKRKNVVANRTVGGAGSLSLFHEDRPDDEIKEKRGLKPPPPSFAEVAEAHLTNRQQAAERSEKLITDRFRVRVHPFQKYSKFNQMLSAERLGPHLEKLRGWLRGKSDVTILIEEDGVIHSYLEWSGKGWSETKETAA